MKMNDLRNHLCVFLLRTQELQGTQTGERVSVCAFCRGVFFFFLSLPILPDIHTPRPPPRLGIRLSLTHSCWMLEVGSLPSVPPSSTFSPGCAPPPPHTSTSLPEERMCLWHLDQEKHLCFPPTSTKSSGVFWTVHGAQEQERSRTGG